MLIRTWDYVVAGAGVWGCTLARLLAENGAKVLLIDKRDCIGGNVRCESIDGIEVHKYGSHIFHTSNKYVWGFVNRFTKFNGYQHHVVARTKYNSKLENIGYNKDYFLPFGLALVGQFFNRSFSPSELNGFLSLQSEVPGKTNMDVLFDVFVKNYTAKQWGVSNMADKVITRLPFRCTYDINYFKDTMWYGIPLDGYNAMFDSMVNHTNITVQCGLKLVVDNSRMMIVDGSDHMVYDANEVCSTAVLYSGPIDELFNYKLGSLPWRSLVFETDVLDKKDEQGSSVINYVDADIPFTRQHEFKHYHPEQLDILNLDRTVVTREYSTTWKVGDEPYYPISSDDSARLYNSYASMVDSFNSNIDEHNPRLIVGGRLGGYKYYDMDKSIENAMTLAKSLYITNKVV